MAVSGSHFWRRRRNSATWIWPARRLRTQVWCTFRAGGAVGLAETRNFEAGWRTGGDGLSAEAKAEMRG